MLENVPMDVVVIANAAFDIVPRKMTMATFRNMRAPDTELIMVEAMYENTK